MTLSSTALKVVIRLPGFVDEATFFAALANDSERQKLQQRARFVAFLQGKPTSKTLAKRASLCWIAFDDRAAATAFWQTNAPTLTFREPESGKPLGVQFDFALVQRVPDALDVRPLSQQRSPPAAWGDDERDFKAFRAIYDAGQTPMLDGVITNDGALSLAIESSRSSFPVATAAAAAATATANAPPPQAAIVAHYIARKRAAKTKKQPAKKGGGGGGGNKKK